MPRTAFSRASQGKTKGSLDLKDYTVSTQNQPEGKLLVLTPNFGASVAKRKEYKLFSKDPNEITEWLTVMTRIFPQKHGWLEKKGQQRWFTIRNSVLWWFAKETFLDADIVKNAKGSLDLTFAAIAPLAGSKPSLVISVPDRDSYVLSSPSQELIDDWLAALQRSAATAITKHEQFLADLATDTAVLEHRGYLREKKEPNFFVLRDEILFQYPSEKQEKLKLKRDLVTWSVVRDKSTSVVLSSFSGDKVELVAFDRKGADVWGAYLQQSCERARRRKDGSFGLMTATPVSASPLSASTIMPAGLSSHGSPATSASRASAAGVSPNRPPSVRPTSPFSSATLRSVSPNRASSSTVGASTIVRHGTRSASPQRLERSAAPVERHSVPSLGGWLFKEGRRRYFLIRGGILFWFADEVPSSFDPAQAKGSLGLGGCVVQKHYHTFSFAIRTAVATTIELTAKTPKEADYWVDLLRSAIYMANMRSSGQHTHERTLQSAVDLDHLPQEGVMIIKGQKRWAVLEQDSLRWFDDQSKTNGKARGSFTLWGCSINDIDNRTLVIASPDALSVSLCFESDSNAAAWLESLQQAICQANSSFDLVHFLSASIGLSKRGWVHKKGKRRWLALRSGTLMWFAEERPLSDIDKAKAKGFIEVSEYTTKISPEDSCSVMIVPKPKEKRGSISAGKAYRITTACDEDALDWVEAMTEGSHRGSILLAHSGEVFGKPLESLPLSENGVPVIIEVLVTHLVTHALKIKGLFRISCNAERAREVRQKLDRRETVAFETTEEECHVVGSLLKSLLRELPEPIFTYELYDRVIAAPDLEAISTLIVSLSPVNRATLSFILQFMRLVHEHAEENQMNETNLSIVFGPNLLRPPPAFGGTGLTEMGDAGKVISLMRLLLQNYDYFFGANAATSVAGMVVAP